MAFWLGFLLIGEVLLILSITIETTISQTESKDYEDSRRILSLIDILSTFFFGLSMIGFEIYSFFIKNWVLLILSSVCFILYAISFIDEIKNFRDKRD